MLLAAIPFINENFFNWTLIGALLVNGLKNGSIYALMALTVVIIYKTTGHLNFAQGEMGTLGAFIVFVLAIEQGWSYWLAIPAALVFSFLLGAALERTLVRPIERRSALGVVIVTLGIFLVINALVAAIWGTQPVTPLAPVPNRPDDQWVLADGPPRLADPLQHARHLGDAGRRRRSTAVLLPEDQARAGVPRRGRQPGVEPAGRACPSAAC